MPLGSSYMSKFSMTTLPQMKCKRRGLLEQVLTNQSQGEEGQVGLLIEMIAFPIRRYVYE